MPLDNNTTTYVEIGELPQFAALGDDDLFELEQDGFSGNATLAVLRAAITAGQAAATRMVAGGGTVSMTSADGELVVMSASGATTVVLPQAVPLGFRCRVSDGEGNADANPIAISAAGAGTINGSPDPITIAFGWQTRLFRSLGDDKWSIL